MFDATPLFRFYAKRRLRQLAALDHVAAQETELFKLVKQARHTRFGTAHRFEAIKTVADYQAAVPLRNYEDFWEGHMAADFPRLTDCIWPGTIPYYCVSSGTTKGATKYLPLTKAMLRSNTRAGLDLLVHHLEHRPKSKILGGKTFMLGGSTDVVQEAPSIFSGDLSGISVKELPWWFQGRYFPPAELALISDWEKKIDQFAALSLDQDIRLFSGVPSWMLIFIEKLSALRPNVEPKLVNFFPHLEMVVHGGVNFAPYESTFRGLIDGSNVELREVYPASEGFIAVADRGYGEGMRLLTDNGIFFEFIPFAELNSPNPTRHWLKNIELDLNYAVVLTTCAGLFSYILGDTVKFVSRDVPRLLVTGRTSYYLSAFGEHLIADEIERAASSAASELQLHLSDYSVGPIFPASTSELGGHLWIIEFKDGKPEPQTLKIFSQKLDAHLCKVNDDYRGHRANGFGLRDPEVLVVESGTFAKWMKSRGKIGGQHKVPRIINDPNLLAGLRSFATGSHPSDS